MVKFFFILVIFSIILKASVTSQYVKPDAASVHHTHHLHETQGFHGAPDSSSLQFQVALKPSPLSYNGAHHSGIYAGYGAQGETNLNDFYVGPGDTYYRKPNTHSGLSSLSVKDQGLLGPLTIAPLAAPYGLHGLRKPLAKPIAHSYIQENLLLGVNSIYGQSHGAFENNLVAKPIPHALNEAGDYYEPLFAPLFDKAAVLAPKESLYEKSYPGKIAIFSPVKTLQASPHEHFRYPNWESYLDKSVLLPQAPIVAAKSIPATTLSGNSYLKDLLLNPHLPPYQHDQVLSQPLINYDSAYAKELSDIVHVPAVPLNIVPAVHLKKIHASSGSHTSITPSLSFGFSYKMVPGSLENHEVNKATAKYYHEAELLDKAVASSAFNAAPAIIAKTEDYNKHYAGHSEHGAIDGSKALMAFEDHFTTAGVESGKEHGLHQH